MEKIEFGGLDFLFKEVPGECVFTPADFSAEHKMIAETVEDFVQNEIVPNINKLELLDLELTRKLMKDAGNLGLLGVEIPEEYGGVGLDEVSAMIVAEKMARGGSFAVSYAVHAGLGTLPVAFFGDTQQKQKYLPAFVSGDLLTAFALTEAEAGSDASAGKCKAVLTEDRRYYSINGTKMWISNAGFADIFIVFARVNEKFTAFIIEKDFGGVIPGLEEKKLGIQGSSTRAVSLENVRVPVENLLGGIGNGFKIALNILNVGRLKVGASCVGGCKVAIEDSIKYANERKQFGKPIAVLNAIKEKIALMIVTTFASESIVYRTAGLIDGKIKGVRDSEALIKGIGEYATECAMCKVGCSEILDFVVDEAVQIHGGYGYSQDYPVERYYRDSRINRIFEGTNEINRLVISSMVIRKASKVKEIIAEICRQTEEEGASPEKTSYNDEIGNESETLARIKNALLIALSRFLGKFRDTILNEQEITFRIAEIVTSIYFCETVLLRVRKNGLSHDENSIQVCAAKAYCHNSFYKMHQLLMEIIESVDDKEKLAYDVALINKLASPVYFNNVQNLRIIADKAIEVLKYPL